MNTAIEFSDLLLNEMSDAIIAKSADGHVLYWNRGAEHVFGYSREEAVGRMVSELIIPPDRMDEEAKILHDVLTAELSQYETTRRRKDESLIYVDVSSKAVRDASGKFKFILSSNKDVTRLKIMRDAKLAEARYGDVLESTPDGILMFNLAGRIILANTRTETLFGYQRGELLGLSVESLLPERLRSGPGRPSRFFVVGRVPHDETARELSGLRKDGNEFPVEISLSPLETGQGTVIMSAIRDVTERKLAEQKFRDQARIMDLVNDSVMVRDMAGRITYWNQGAQRIYGWSPNEAVGRVSHELLKTVFSAPFDEIQARLLKEEHWEGELVHSCRDGTRLTVASRWTLQKNGGDQPNGVIELNYDITERKQFERALQEKNIELENAAASKNRFLANMSHELRTPLNGIIGFAEFLVDGRPGPLNPKQKEYLGDILASGRHLLQLINDILDLAKVEANRMDLHPETLQLAKAVEGVCAVARPIALKKHIALNLLHAPEVTEVTLDPQKFKQILYNLLSNALKFTDEHGRVDVVTEARGPGHFALIVRDTGIGIRKEEFPRLFREFEQLESGVGRRYEGTGLGLALTRKLVELHGGSIGVESETGHGSTFTVVFPRMRGVK